MLLVRKPFISTFKQNFPRAALVVKFFTCQIFANFENLFPLKRYFLRLFRFKVVIDCWFTLLSPSSGSSVRILPNNFLLVSFFQNASALAWSTSQIEQNTKPNHRHFQSCRHFTSNISNKRRSLECHTTFNHYTCIYYNLNFRVLRPSQMCQFRLREILANFYRSF